MNTRVYTLSMNQYMNEEQVMKYASGLSVNRQEKIQRTAAFSGKLQSLGAGLLLNYGLGQYGLKENDVVIDYKQNGKPYLPEHPQIHFNLSHSGTMVMAVFSDYEVGCDIEQIGTARMEVAKRFFSPEETRFLNQLSGEPQRDAFFRLWTLKESFLKVTGEGMRMPLNQFSIRLGNGGCSSVIRKAKETPSAVDKTEGIETFPKQKEYFFHEFSLEGYKAAICIEGAPWNPEEDGFFSFQNMVDVV